MTRSLRARVTGSSCCSGTRLERQHFACLTGMPEGSHCNLLPALWEDAAIYYAWDGSLVASACQWCT